MPDLKRFPEEEMRRGKSEMLERILPGPLTGWPSKQVYKPGRSYEHPEPPDVEARWELAREMMEQEGAEQYADLPQDVATAPESRNLYVPILGKYLTPAEFTAFRKLWEAGRGDEWGGDVQGFDPTGEYKMPTFEGAPEVFEDRPLTPEAINPWDLGEWGRGAAPIRKREESKDLGYRSRIRQILKDALGAGEEEEMPPGIEVTP